jgi:hypothetical protein
MVYLSGKSGRSKGEEMEGDGERERERERERVRYGRREGG